jgi:hypothetical protein
MTRKVFEGCVLLLALASFVSAQGTVTSTETGAYATRSQLKQLVRDACTPEQYRILASYYGEQQTEYLKQAAEEKQEWVRRSQNIMGVAAKYPRPVDSARYLYEYSMYKAGEAEALSAKYSRLAAPEGTVKVK